MSAGPAAPRPVPPVLAKGLALLVVGYNPGRRSGATGHHFAGPGNRFWRLLAASGWTPAELRPEQDRELPRYGLGIVNLVDRVTPGSADLSWSEMVEGGRRVRALAERWRPRRLACLGKDVARAVLGLARAAPLEWSPEAGQLDCSWGRLPVACLPNPSARSTVPPELQLALWRELAAAAGAGGEAR
ncbi:MAG: mismatch-specific DNA-glycosylase [Clostridia bacterium]|nr:mismatch-specific DNA-glycosylase [Clostridia bacterium]